MVKGAGRTLTLLAGLVAGTGAAMLPVAVAEAGNMYGLVKSCVAADDPSRCERRRKDFAAALPLAHKGDHDAQVMVAFCLSTGCRGALPVDPVMACAWHLVIANGKFATVNDSTNRKNECRPLTSEQKVKSRSLAVALFAKIYRRPAAAWVDEM